MFAELHSKGCFFIDRVDVLYMEYSKNWKLILYIQKFNLTHNLKRFPAMVNLKNDLLIRDSLKPVLEDTPVNPRRLIL